MKFYTGLHQPGDARHFDRAFVSVNRLRTRRSAVPCRAWILDSGAFSEIARHGGYRHTPEAYAAEVNRIAALNPGLEAAVSQDYMCEPVMLAKTGLTVAEHQRRTIERYDAILPLVGVPLMPVLQGYAPESYLEHIRQYGARLRPGMRVGVGSVCKRNSDLAKIRQILLAIKQMAPYLQLHGFGLKTIALESGWIRACLTSADSMAWSFAARREGRDRNSWREAKDFTTRIDTMEVREWG